MPNVRVTIEPVQYSTHQMLCTQSTQHIVCKSMRKLSCLHHNTVCTMNMSNRNKCLYIIWVYKQ